MPWMICYVGFICRVMIQNCWNKRLKGINCDDELICLYMPWKIQLVLAGRLVSILFLMVIHTSTPVSQLCQPTPDKYNQFNLPNINAPIPPKWKNNENILEDFKKFKRSCMHIFHGPMAHITNGKV